MLRDRLIELHDATLRWPRIFNILKISGLFRLACSILCNFLIIYGDNKIGGTQNSDIIISLTSFPRRIDKVWITIITLLQQSLKPQKVILWLSKEQFPTTEILPGKLLKLTEKGLEIRLVESDLKSHKKYYYAFKEFPNNPVLLVDDDIIYHSKMAEELHRHFNSSKVHFGYGYKMCRDINCNILQYKDWKHLPRKSRNKDLFFGSGGGTLMVPSHMYKDCLREDLFMELTPNADDVWLNAMARLAGLTLEKVRNESTVPVIIDNDAPLSSTNLGLSENDLQINKVNNYYLRDINQGVF